MIGDTEPAGYVVARGTGGEPTGTTRAVVVAAFVAAAAAVVLLLVGVAAASRAVVCLGTRVVSCLRRRPACGLSALWATERRGRERQARARARVRLVVTMGPEED
mgnify:FL=1